MARRRFDSKLQTVTEINVTPLMDLTFLLLIVFMITAPVLEFETDVSPPQMTTDKPIDEDKEPVMISLDKQGRIILQKKTIDTAERLTRRLSYMHQQRPDLAALIRADGNRPYREIIALMKAVRAANITDVSLVTQPES
jgi:biopolymer transport protein ExbD